MADLEKIKGWAQNIVDECGSTPPTPPTPPTPVDKLPTEMRYETTKKVVSPMFLKGLPHNIGDYSRADKEYVANRLTRKTCGNYLRFLDDFGVYGPDTIPMLIPFFKKDGNGRFLTRTFEVNPTWEDEFLYSIGLFHDRGWQIEHNLLNNSTCHNAAQGYWKAHPARRGNNTGMFVPELNEVHPTHPDRKSWIGHCFEWSNFELKWREKYPDGEGTMSDEDRLDMNGNRATRELFKKYMKYMCDLLHAHFGNTWFFGLNEWERAENFHMHILRPLLRGYGVGSNRLVTSLGHNDWYMDKKNIFNAYRGSSHGIYYYDNVVRGPNDVITLEQHIEEDLPPSHEFIFSGDGATWGKYGKNYGKLKETVKRCLNMGHGFELNQDWWGKDSSTNDWHAIKVVGDGYKEWLG